MPFLLLAQEAPQADGQVWVARNDLGNSLLRDELLQDAREDHAQDDEGQGLVADGGEIADQVRQFHASILVDKAGQCTFNSAWVVLLMQAFRFISFILHPPQRSRRPQRKKLEENPVLLHCLLSLSLSLRSPRPRR